MHSPHENYGYILEFMEREKVDTRYITRLGEIESYISELERKFIELNLYSELEEIRKNYKD